MSIAHRLKKRKLNGNESVPTSTSSKSKPKRSPRSSSKETQTKKRRREEQELEDDDSDKEKDIFSTYSIRKLLKADTTLNASNFVKCASTSCMHQHHVRMCQQISSDAAKIIGKAASVFMAELLRGSMANSKNNKLEYDDIATYIDAEDNLSFLSDIIPKRVLFSEVSGKDKEDDEAADTVVSKQDEDQENCNNNTTP